MHLLTAQSTMATVLGLHPTETHIQEVRREDAFELKVALDSKTTPEWSRDLSEALDRTSSLFLDLADQKSVDWLRTSALMSHPSPQLAKRIGNGLSVLKQELENDEIDGINSSLARLEKMHLPQIVERYLGLTRPKSPDRAERISNWAYVLKPLGSNVIVGVTEGTLEDALSDHQQEIVAVVGAWRITDSKVAEQVVDHIFEQRSLSGNKYAVRDMSDAKDLTNGLHEALSADMIIVGNPLWRHRKGLMEIDPFSHDISNKCFESDAESVFQAFRR